MFELEPKRFLYNRTGIMSETTAVNDEVATRFMKVSDLRRHIVIVDSGKEPEKNAVAVSSDTLAWRSVAPISELAKIVHRPRRYHQVETDGDVNIVSIHDKVIDADIRKTTYSNKEEYEQRFLERLQTEVKSAVIGILFEEKLGFREQRHDWITYLIGSPVLLSVVSSGDYWNLVKFGVLEFGLLHPFSNMAEVREFKKWEEFNRFSGNSFIPPDVNPRSWKKSFYPLLPVEKWAAGRLLLAQHGNELIAAKN